MRTGDMLAQLYSANRVAAACAPEPEPSPEEAAPLLMELIRTLPRCHCGRRATHYNGSPSGYTVHLCAEHGGNFYPLAWGGFVKRWEERMGVGP